MPTCPKCGFSGRDESSCERCGVIYDRLRERRPSDGTLPTPTASDLIAQAFPGARPTPTAVLPVTPSANEAIAQAFPGARAPLRPAPGEPTPGPSRPMDRPELTPLVLPHIDQAAGRGSGRRLPWLLATFGLLLGAWGWNSGLLVWGGGSEAQSAEPPLEFVDFDLAFEALLEDARQLTPTLAERLAGAEDRARLRDRLALLKGQLPGANVSPRSAVYLRDAVEAFEFAFAEPALAVVPASAPVPDEAEESQPAEAVALDPADPVTAEVLALDAVHRHLESAAQALVRARR